MPTPPVTITLVRHRGQAADAVLRNFVDGGTEAGRRAPRGIDPEFVSYWLRENIKPDCSPSAMMRTGDLLRFYERKDVLDAVSRLLTRNESQERAFRVSMYALQAIGEVGTLEQQAFATRYLNEFLLPQPVAMDFFNLVLETAEALAPAVDMAAVGRRLQAAIDAVGTPKDLNTSAAIPYMKYSDYRTLSYPAAVRTVEAKRRLLAIAPAGRLQELLFIYLGESPLSSPAMITWSGRLLRQHAMADGQDAVLAALAAILDGALGSQMPKPKKEFIVQRAAQAIVYLQGKLTFPQEAAFDAIKPRMLNFLWDDIG